MSDKLRVLILYGGRSSEHEVSCLSARSVLAAIDRDRYEVIAVGVTRSGRWTLTDGIIAAPSEGSLPHVDDAGETVALVRGREGAELVRFLPDDTYVLLGKIDVAFPVLHGPYGEDGTMQGLLASVGVPYVGADVTASSVGVDKRAMKNAFKARGLPQLPYLAVRRGRYEVERGALVDEIEGALGYPLFTKPARQGSSIGIARVTDRAGLIAGIEEAFEYDRVCIVEKGLDRPRELEVGALGNDVFEITPPGEIRPSHEFYDFESKYLDASELILPAQIDDEVAKELEQIARQAYLAIGCRGMARIDFFLSQDGELVLNEINTIPGFTPTSMFPRLWEATGVGYSELIDRLLQLAMDAAEESLRFAP